MRKDRRSHQEKSRHWNQDFVPQASARNDDEIREQQSYRLCYHRDGQKGRVPALRSKKDPLQAIWSCLSMKN